jgi:hypothetical protein
MQIKITWQYIIAFIAFNMLMGELHEQAHINTGYFICGCYGVRDFNVWQTCSSCSNPGWAFMATLAGPVFSCSMMWLGALWFCKKKNRQIQSIGFALLFANLPFARIFTALTGGGDEKVVVLSLMKGNSNIVLGKIIASLIVTAICLPPIIITGKKLAGQKRWLIVSGFCVLPLIYGMLYHHLFLNWLLKKGYGANTVMLGTPNIILFHFALMLFLLLLFNKSFTGSCR